MGTGQDSGHKRDHQKNKQAKWQKIAPNNDAILIIFLLLVSLTSYPGGGCCVVLALCKEGLSEKSFARGLLIIVLL
jgi:hypothetical protein